MSETLMTTEAATPTEGQAASNPEAQTATVAVEGVQEQAQATQQAEQQPEPVVQVPVSYEFTVPEGIEVHEGAKETYAEVAKELGLTQEKAQAAFEKLATKSHANQAALVQATHAKWDEQVFADPEIGGEKYEASIATAKKGLEAFATPGLMQLLKESGLYKNPDVIKTFLNVGAKVSEDKFIPGGPGNPSKQSAVNMYPASKMNP